MLLQKHNNYTQICISSFCSIAYCLMLLYCSGTLQADNAQDNGDTGALHITTKTSLCSAAYYLGHSDNDAETDTQRSSVGIGEDVTITLEGKPKGEIQKLIWSFESGKNLIEEINDDSLKGTSTLRITVRKDLSLSELSNPKIKLKVTTSNGHVISMDNALIVIFPSGIKAKHLMSGSPMNGTVNNSGQTEPSAQLHLTLQPENVNFSKIKVIERDLGSEHYRSNKSLDEGHKGHGVDRAGGIDIKNQFFDDLRLKLVHADLLSTGDNPPLHKLPQSWIWKCSFKVHKGIGGPNSEKDDVGEIEKRVDQKFEAFYLQNEETKKIIGASAKISKFGCSVYCNSIQHTNKYEGDKENNPPNK